MPAAFHPDYRQSIAQAKGEDIVRRLRRAYAVGALMWPPFFRAMACRRAALR
ncbi:MAG TPA: hypothetical protein VK509_24280 [Polyangiales bacterium]|nr:hypothetical protein [Polyangiales bacterium]